MSKQHGKKWAVDRGPPPMYNRTMVNRALIITLVTHYCVDCLCPAVGSNINTFLNTLPTSRPGAPGGGGPLPCTTGTMVNRALIITLVTHYCVDCLCPAKLFFCLLFWRIKTIQFQSCGNCTLFGLQLLFTPCNFAVLLGSSNLQNEGCANKKGFTIAVAETIFKVKEGHC